MHPDVRTVDRPQIRGADTNSLLRMSDAARGVADESPSRLERARAGRTMGRIARELGKRNVLL